MAKPSRETRTGKGSPPKWARQLKRRMDPDVVSLDPAELSLYDRDAAPLPASAKWAFNPRPDAVVRPRIADQVRKVVRFAAKAGVPIVPRGAATWGFGGAVPANGGIVFDLQGLSDITVDRDTMTVTAGAGAIWRDVADLARRRGFMLPAYPTSAPGSTVGGWINTGGVGVGAFKYGGIDKQVRSLRVVLPNGELVRLGFDRVLPNSSGYDLKSLIIGSEGTLGVVTEATLELVPAPETTRPLAAGFPSAKELGDFVQLLARSRITPFHVSFYDPAHLTNLERLGEAVPYGGGLVSIMFEGYASVVDWEWDATAELVQKAGGEVAGEEYARTTWDDHLFDLRVAREGPTLLMNEVFVPLSRTTEVMAGMARIIESHGVPGGIVGTAASRSTASLMPYALVDERKWSTFFAYGLVDEFAQLSLDLGGRPAGVGLWMAYQMPALHDGGLDAMRAIKRALDPKDIMNPGKLVHAVSKFDLAIPAGVMNMGTKTISMVHALLAEERKVGTQAPGPKRQVTSDDEAEMVEEERAEDMEDAPPNDDGEHDKEG
ncbi:MAG: FAD-binding oxidoreductase [Thermoplasmata archaeon]|nr:FAD-binding oxidoreductase [Thermoplasmata archaeon]